MHEASSQPVKRRHALNECRDADDFLANFHSRLGTDLANYLRRLVPGLGEFTAWLVGSIPAGVATPVSDIDILVSVPTQTPLRLPSSRSSPAMLYSGDQHARLDSLHLGDLVMLVDGIEVDFSFISADGLDDLCRQVERGGSLTSQQILVLSRAMRGWRLTGPTSSGASLSELRESRSLETHCTVRYLVGAFKHVEDAAAALPDEPLLACHLARLCVEKCFEAALASQGELAVGVKWLRRLARASKGTESEALMLRELRRVGETLLFPRDATDAPAAAEHVRSAHSFFQQTVAVIGHDVAIRIAIRSCPQLRLISIDLP